MGEHDSVYSDDGGEGGPLGLIGFRPMELGNLLFASSSSSSLGVDDCPFFPAGLPVTLATTSFVWSLKVIL